MKLYVFTSMNLTNLWAGIGARRWAVPVPGDVMRRTLDTKSQSVLVGSSGVFYCSETKTLTTPFLVYSVPDKAALVDNVWPETWAYPFAIHPLGSPNKQMPKDDAMAELEIAKAKGSTNISHVLNITPTTVFSPNEVVTEDWSLLLDRLAD